MLAFPYVLRCSIHSAGAALTFQALCKPSGQVQAGQNFQLFARLAHSTGHACTNTASCSTQHATIMSTARSFVGLKLYQSVHFPRKLAAPVQALQYATTQLQPRRMLLIRVCNTALPCCHLGRVRLPLQQIWPCKPCVPRYSPWQDPIARAGISACACKPCEC